jgi:hypothetical protein
MVSPSQQLIYVVCVGSCCGIAAQHGKICRDLSIQKGKLLKFRSRKFSQPVLIRSGKQQSQPVPMRLALTNPLVR